MIYNSDRIPPNYDIFEHKLFQLDPNTFSQTSGRPLEYAGRSYFPFTISLLSTDPSFSSKPHSNALATFLLLATADSPATKSRRAPRTRLVTVNERTLTVHRIGIRERGRLLGLEILTNLSYPGVEARFLSHHTAYDVRPKH